MTLTDEQRHRVLRRGVARIIPEDEFVERLDEGRPLRLKMGFDPSAPDIHLGHAVGLRKLRQLQDLGHTVVIIVGDWTAQIGDPSGRSATRPMLTHEQVVQNAETYLAQFFKIVDRDRAEVRWQSDWFGPFSLADVIRLTSKFTVAQFLQRDDFANRFQANQPIAITELLYPLLQAYDSVAIKSDRRIRRHRPDVQPVGRTGPPGDGGTATPAVLPHAHATRHRRRPENEQEPRQLHWHRRAREGDLRQDNVAARQPAPTLLRVPHGRAR